MSRAAIRAPVAYGGRAIVPAGALVLRDVGRVARLLPGGRRAPDGWRLTLGGEEVCDLRE